MKRLTPALQHRAGVLATQVLNKTYVLDPDIRPEVLDLIVSHLIKRASDLRVERIAAMEHEDARV